MVRNGKTKLLQFTGKKGDGTKSFDNGPLALGPCLFLLNFSSDKKLNTSLFALCVTQTILLNGCVP